MSNLKDIARKNIRFYRKLQGMTRSQLGKRLGKNACYIKKLEHGRKKLRLSQLDRIAGLLQVPVLFLLTKIAVDKSEPFLEKQLQVWHSNCRACFPNPYALGNKKDTQEKPDLKYELVECLKEKYPGDRLSFYGIRAVIQQGSQTRIQDQIQDICTDRKELSELVRALNQHQASLLHFRDIIQDFCDSDYKLHRSFRC